MAVRSLKNSTIENFANYSSSMNAGYSFQDYELIESVFIASPAATVSFNNLNQYSTEYKHLQMRCVTRATSTNGGYPTSAFMRFNADSGANYFSHNLRGNGSTVAASPDINQTSITNGLWAPGLASSWNSNAFHGEIIDILDPFSTSKNTTLRSFGGATSVSSAIRLGSGAWNNTASITSISFESDALYLTSFAVGSRFSLYGIR